jgi:FkbM family methyltransferase
MFIKIQDLVSKYGLKIKGIIHAGAHHGQEYDDYKAVGVDRIIFVEPCYPAFKELKKRFINSSGVICIQTALGEYNGEAEMHVEVANTGQSNSILKPKLHLQQHPDIQFPSVELVKMTRLDEMIPTLVKMISDVPDEPMYNFLNMDVQGYELNVLKGAGKILDQIDYIYTEVNTDEIYEGCAKINELDAFLKDFDRVETNMAGGNWGDAFYVRRPKQSELPAGVVKKEAKVTTPLPPHTDPYARIEFLEGKLKQIYAILEEIGIYPDPIAPTPNVTSDGE